MASKATMERIRKIRDFESIHPTFSSRRIGEELGMDKNTVEKYRFNKDNPRQGIDGNYQGNGSKKPTCDNQHLYFIKGGGLIKIGVAFDIATRFSQIQYMSPVTLELMAVFLDMGHLEKKLHGTLYRYRKHGEWFEPSDKVMEMLDKLKKECVNDGKNTLYYRHIQAAKKMHEGNIHD